MRHRKKGRKFGMVRKVRRALLKGLARSLLLHGHIKTTEAKAKETKPFAEKLITRSKHDTIANRRLMARLFDKKTVNKMFSEVGPKYAERRGGYARITRLNKRSDNAQMVMLELV